MIGVGQTLEGVQIATNRTTCQANKGAWRSREKIRYSQEQNCMEAMDVYTVVGSVDLQSCCCWFSIVMEREQRNGTGQKPSKVKYGIEQNRWAYF